MIRVLGDIDLAEDAVAEAFAIAAEQWPTRGVPPNPGGWITTTARNRAVDRLRRESTRTGRHLAALRLEADDVQPDPDPDLDDLDGFVDVVADDQLRLMFLCRHPALATDAQVALTLRLQGGLDTPEIARAFLVAEPTLAQRIVRAKRKLRDNHAPYRVPRAPELPDRLHAVLAAIYLIYTEGHTATTGDSLTRVDLSREAIRLADQDRTQWDRTWAATDRFTVVEIKTLSRENQERQLRLGLGQVLRYRQALHVRHDRVQAVLAVEPMRSLPR